MSRNHKQLFRWIENNFKSLTGLLNFVCQVILPGRAFLRCTTDLTVAKKHSIILGELPLILRQIYFYGRISWTNLWCMVLPTRTLDIEPQSPPIHEFSCQVRVRWYCFMADYKIATLAQQFLQFQSGEQHGRNAVFHTDNQALVHIINSQTLKYKGTMVLVRRLAHTCLQYNIYFNTKHLPGHKNILAYYLSRLQISAFKRAAQWAEDSPTHVPQPLALLSQRSSPSTF